MTNLVDDLREDADSYHDATADKEDCWNVTAALERHAADEIERLNAYIKKWAEDAADTDRKFQALEQENARLRAALSELVEAIDYRSQVYSYEPEFDKAKAALDGAVEPAGEYEKVFSKRDVEEMMSVTLLARQARSAQETMPRHLQPSYVLEQIMNNSTDPWAKGVARTCLMQSPVSRS